jgi:hypothetical protein
MEELLDQLNQRLQEIDISDYYLDEFKDERLVLLGSFDLSYYHDVEIVFEGVQYICCPTYVESPRFRIADEAEQKRALEHINGHIDLDEGNYIISIDGDDDLGLILKLEKHFDLAVRLEARKHPGGMVVVEQLAAEFQIQLSSE